jgi:hypothetical protein
LFLSVSALDLAQNSNVQDAFVIAVEQQARERLERLSALKRIKPVDMTKLSQQVSPVCLPQAMTSLRKLETKPCTTELVLYTPSLAFILIYCTNDDKKDTTLHGVIHCGGIFRRPQTKLFGGPYDITDVNWFREVE